MELFTLGIGAYTEDDVKAGARALTGWTHRPAATQARLGRRSATTRRKTILGQTADFDADALRRPAGGRSRPTPTFLAASAVVPVRLVEPMPPRPRPAWSPRTAPATTSAAMLRALLLRSARSPTTRAAGQAAGGVGWSARCASSASAAGDLADSQRRQLLSGLDGLGQVPLRPPSVGGWPAGAAWLTTSSLQARLRAGRRSGRRRPVSRAGPPGRRPAGRAPGGAGPPAGGRRVDRPHPGRARRGRRRPAPPADRSAWPAPSTRSAEEEPTWTP